MAGLISQPFIDDLLNRTDIVDVIGSRITLKKTGKNYSARCPFHNEKTPSFTVSPDKQFYYCFGCGAGGNALGFVMDHDHLDFPQAVEELARQAGVEVLREETGLPPKPRQATDSPLYALMAAASNYYRQALKSHSSRGPAINYLKGRGLTGIIARDFGLGLAPPGWDNLLKHLGGDALQQKAMIDAGLLIENPETGKRYDRFRDRIMFPIRDSRGRVIAFGGRVLGDDKPKYLNSPETPIFHKGQELYGLFEARQHNRHLDEILVVEGYMDVIALAQQNLRNAVATLGTATSTEHLKRLFRITPSILFCFDGDQAGRKAAWRALEAALPCLLDGRRTRFLFLPEGEDPDSLVRSEGPDAFRARMQQQAQPLADYFFQKLGEEAAPNSLEGKAHLAALAAPLIDQIPGANLRRLMLQRLSELTGLNDEALQAASATLVTAPAQLPYFRDAATDSDPGQQAPISQKQIGRRPQRQDYQPRLSYRPSTVEPPILTTLRTLLRYPEFAQKVEDASNFAAEEDTYFQLLVALLGALQKSPNLRSLQLMARWHGTDQGRLLRALAEKEWLISEDNLEQQFFDTINKLAARQHEQRLESLLCKARESELSKEEKEQLCELLQHGTSLPTPASTGTHKQN
ncbi:DNA primase [Azomonas macrocytogenes]|uniref:DNA primase n=1 Tax=Azomonas macrocytogenes TaxID=69962 RepID=A0A839T0N8_AZOMA|nr:DNA primase [Azomonas macrocytogenes]MBB3102100.1 DNA primase [Azomonas macrocytogenes]